MIWHRSGAPGGPPVRRLPPQDVHGAWSDQWANVWQGAPDTYRVQPRASFAGPIGSFLRGLRRAVPVPPRINDAARAAELARNLSAYPAQRRTMRAALDADPQTD